MRVQQPYLIQLLVPCCLVALIGAALACANPLATPPAAVFIEVGPDPSITASPDDLRAAGDVIQARLQTAGMFHGMTVGEDRLRIFVGGQAEIPAVSQLATEPGVVIFFPSTTALAQGDPVPAGAQPILTGKDVASAKIGQNGQSGLLVVNVTFTPDGAKILADFTTAHVGEMLVIAQDGVVLSAPVINAPITGGNAEIAGDFTRGDVSRIAQELSSGPLPIKLVVISTGTP